MYYATLTCGVVFIDDYSMPCGKSVIALNVIVICFISDVATYLL